MSKIDFLLTCASLDLLSLRPAVTTRLIGCTASASGDETRVPASESLTHDKFRHSPDVAARLSNLVMHGIDTQMVSTRTDIHRDPQKHRRVQGNDLHRKKTDWSECHSPILHSRSPGTGKDLPDSDYY